MREAVNRVPDDNTLPVPTAQILECVRDIRMCEFGPPFDFCYEELNLSRGRKKILWSVSGELLDPTRLTEVGKLEAKFTPQHANARPGNKLGAFSRRRSLASCKIPSQEPFNTWSTGVDEPQYIACGKKLAQGAITLTGHNRGYGNSRWQPLGCCLDSNASVNRG